MQRTAVKMTRVLSMEYVINCFLFKAILAFKRLIYFLMCLLLLFCNDSYILTYPFSKSLWIWTVVFTEKLLPFPKSTLPISTFLSWMSTFESPMSTFSSFKSPLIWRFRLWSAFFSFKSRFLRNASRYSVAHTIISISFLYSFFNFDLSWI